MIEAFERFLKNPTNGIPSDYGFNSATEAAMFVVMMNPGDETAIAKARSRFANQLRDPEGEERDLIARVFENRRK